jgi:hypothetical protein
MRKRQWTVLGIAAGIFLLSAIFPPWLYTCESMSYSAGYHFFANPPEPKDICRSSNPLPAPPPTVLRNGDRQTVQAIIIITLSAGLLLLLRIPRTNLSLVLAVLIICIGAVALLCLGLMIQFGM